jgi:ankyrin repeat protein
VLQNTTPLFAASVEGHTEVVELLLKANADVDLANEVANHQILIAHALAQ